MEWLGVGNVDGVVVRADDLARPRTHGVCLRGGVVGHEMPDLHRAEPVALHAGDTLVIATDGVRGDLAEAAMTDLLADRLARRVLAEKASPTDDALVLVARFRPRRPPASPPRGVPAAAADVPEAPPAAAPGTGTRP
jgi:hypothetical protein